MKKIACVGIMVADVIVEPVEKYPEPGLLVPVNSITMHNGGNAMTASINLHKLGVESSLIGGVGNDMFGDYLKNCLAKADVKIDGIKTYDNVQTSTSVLMIDENTGERSFFHCRGANGALSIDDIDFDIVKNNDVVFVTGTFLLDTFDGVQTMEFLKKCKEMGKTTFLDVCWDSTGKWSEILDCAMTYIDFFMPSIDEAIMLTGKEDLKEISDVFFTKGVKTVVIKCGSKGCYCRADSQSDGVMIPVYKVENVVDTTGAGDSFCSGFLAAYARGEDILTCAKVGNATGAHCCMKKGATEGIKTYQEIIDFMNEEVNKNVSNIK